MSYACPYVGTKRAGPRGMCEKPMESVRGWKRHMTRWHSGYDEGQLASIVGATAIDSSAGRAAFLAESDSPGVDTPGQDKETPNGEADASTHSPTAPAPEPVKRVPLKSERFMKFLNTLPERLFKEKGIELDAEDKEMMATGTEMMEGLFGVAFEIPESMWVIRSRWMALLFPIGAILLVYLKHTFSFDMFKPKTDADGNPLEDAVKKARESA